MQALIIEFSGALVLSLKFKVLTMLCVFFGVTLFVGSQVGERTSWVKRVAIFFEKKKLLSMWFRSMGFLSFGRGDYLRYSFIRGVKTVVLVEVEKGWVENMLWGIGIGEIVFRLVSFVRGGILKELGVGLFFGVVFLFVVLHG